jgi:hypothetical protein
MSLDALIGAAEPSIAAHARSDPGPGEFDLPDQTRSFVLEAIREGYLLHYGEPRAFDGMDEDLRLLGGDALYALGLTRLAEAGDLEAVTALADLIAACAQAESEGRSTPALWDAAARQLGG